MLENKLVCVFEPIVESEWESNDGNPTETMRMGRDCKDWSCFIDQLRLNGCVH